MFSRRITRLISTYVAYNLFVMIRMMDFDFGGGSDRVFVIGPAASDWRLDPRQLDVQVKKLPEKLPLCGIESLKTGKWVRHRLSKPPYNPPQMGKSAVCYPEQFGGDHWDTWKWLPLEEEQEKCTFPDWNMDFFCKVASGETISLIGDSLTWEHFQSLISLHGKTAPFSSSKVTDFNTVIHVCDGSVKLVYRRDNYLSNITRSVAQDFPTIIVLNKGAHLAPNKAFLETLRGTLRDVMIWLRECKARGHECDLLWRTSVPGHPNCGRFTEPVNDLKAMEAYITDPINYQGISHNLGWKEYQQQNLLAIQELQELGVKHTVMDAYYINVLRPDAHNPQHQDCLHNCYPGKMDVYSQILQHFLAVKYQKANAMDKLPPAGSILAQ